METGGGTKTWETLDSLALARILSHLPPKDKLSAGLVCKTWKTVSRSPELWKNVELAFTGSQTRFNNAIKFFNSNSPRPTSIKISFHSSNYGERFNAVRSAALYLKHVANEQKNVQEITLEFFDLVQSYYEGATIALIKTTIQEFLSTQVQLRSLNFQNLRIPFSDGIDVLRTMATSNKNLTKLDLSSDFFEYFAVHENNYALEYGSLLGSFQNLSSLSLSLADITDATLRVLADSFTDGKLKLFSVAITELGKRNWFVMNKITRASEKHVSRLVQNNPGLVIRISSTSMKGMSAIVQNAIFTRVTNMLLRTRMRTKPWLLFSDRLESPAPGLRMELLDKEDRVAVNCYGLLRPDQLLHRFLNRNGGVCPRLQRVDYDAPLAPSRTGSALIMGELNAWTRSAAGRAFTVTYPPPRPRRTPKRKRSDSPSTEETQNVTEYFQ